MAADDTSPKWDTVASYAEKMVSGAAPGLESESKDKLRPEPATEKQPKQRQEPAETSEPSEPAPPDEPEAVEETEPVEETDEETEALEDESPAYVTVKIDGKEEQVTLEEALKGYSRQQDYTRKAQDLARERESQKADFEAVRKEREQYAEALKQLEAANQPSEPDWGQLRSELSSEAFSLRVAEWQIEQNNLRKLQAERERTEAKIAEDRSKEMQSHLVREQELLLAAIPEWSDSTKATTEHRQLAEYGKSLGFTEQEVASITDHRAVVLLRKAMLYDKAKQTPNPKVQPQGTQAKTQTTQPTITTMRPGTTTQIRKPVSDVTRSKQSLAKTGTIQSAAMFFEAFDATEEAEAARRR